jgi:hypothetical protein
MKECELIREGDKVADYLDELKKNNIRDWENFKILDAMSEFGNIYLKIRKLEMSGALVRKQDEWRKAKQKQNEGGKPR